LNKAAICQVGVDKVANSPAHIISFAAESSDSYNFKSKRLFACGALNGL
jgi:hypothetical protein